MKKRLFSVLTAVCVAVSLCAFAPAAWAAFEDIDLESYVSTTVTVGGILNLPDVIRPDGPVDAITVTWSILSNVGSAAGEIFGVGDQQLWAERAGLLVLQAVLNDGNDTDTRTVAITVQSGGFVPVTDIAGVPTHASVGVNLPLTGASVQPSNATGKDIVWGVLTQNGTGAIINSGVFRATAEGTAQIVATVVDGTAPGVPYTQEFSIHVDYIPVENITGIPSNMSVNQTLTLNGVVSPSNATNKAIVWTIAEADETNATLAGNTLRATAQGTITLRATIVGGTASDTDFTQDFQIDVGFIRVTGITGLPSRGVVRQAVPLSGTVSPSNATHQLIAWSLVNDANSDGTCDVTGAVLTGNSVILNSLGTAASVDVRLRATIQNGVSETAVTPLPTEDGTDPQPNLSNHFVQDFTVTFTATAGYNVTVSVNTSAYGTAYADPTYALAGETVFLTAQARAGYYFSHWEVLSGSLSFRDYRAMNTYFVMPSGGVSVRAVFTPDRYGSEYNYNRYTVLALDVSSSMRGAPLEREREAAIELCRYLLNDGAENRIAVVSYSNTVVTEIDFSSDLSALTREINQITLGGETADLYAALERANALTNQIQTPLSVTKHIVLLSDSLPNSRQNSGSGRYTSVDHRYYMYCNSVYELATQVKNRGNELYSVSFLHDWVRQNEFSSTDVSFQRRFMRDLQNAGYYETDIPANLYSTYRQVASDILRLAAPSVSAPNDGSLPNWAASETSQAVSAGLVPPQLQAQYNNSITRAEFCAMAVLLYERVRGTISVPGVMFYDTSDINVGKMAALGVVYGVGGSRFNPNGALTREQAAAILSRLAQVVGRPLPYGAASYADLGSAFDYAKAAIGQVQAAGVMEGVAAGYFSPKTAYTRAQSIATIWRLYNYVR